jgi:hypothetical protein
MLLKLIDIEVRHEQIKTGENVANSATAFMWIEDINSQIMQWKWKNWLRNPDKGIDKWREFYIWKRMYLI